MVSEFEFLYNSTTFISDIFTVKKGLICFITSSKLHILVNGSPKLFGGTSCLILLVFPFLNLYSKQ